MKLLNKVCMYVPSKYCFASLIFQLRNIWFQLYVSCCVHCDILADSIIRNYSDLLWFSKFFRLSIKIIFEKRQLYWNSKFVRLLPFEIFPTLLVEKIPSRWSKKVRAPGTNHLSNFNWVLDTVSLSKVVHLNDSTCAEDMSFSCNVAP